MSTAATTPGVESALHSDALRTDAATVLGQANREARDLVGVGQKRLLGNYRQPPIVLDRAKGCEVFDSEGRRYLDFCAGVAVTSLGHAHPRLTARIAEQAGRLMHVSNYFFNAENVCLADELCERFGFDRAFFCNSGTEANEALLKLARRHFWSQGRADRCRIIAFKHAFHGRTMGSLSLTGTPKYQEGFGPVIGGVTHVPYGDVAAVRAAMGPDVAAIIVEPILGEGGVINAPSGFLAELRQITQEVGALLLVDEVQTGIGRTGHWLGIDHDGVKPDAISLAKGLGGGFPIGAMLVREYLNNALPPGSHGSTFGGNALASTAARTVLSVIEEDGLVEAARVRGDHLRRGLESLVAKYPHACSGERGRGLLRGLVLAPGLESRNLLGPIRDAGVLLTAAGNDVLRFTPPLIVTDAEIDEAIGRIAVVLAETGR